MPSTQGPELLQLPQVDRSHSNSNKRIYDDYFRQLLLCRVALGKSFLQFSAMKMAHAPPGHHSVVGRFASSKCCHGGSFKVILFGRL